VAVEPALKPIDVSLGVGQAGVSTLVRKVGIDPIRGRVRLLDDDGDERDGKPTSWIQSGIWIVSRP
jgi:hypothetical protein